MRQIVIQNKIKKDFQVSIVFVFNGDARAVAKLQIVGPRAPLLTLKSVIFLIKKKWSGLQHYS
jgi:hypothetical protein